MSRQSELAAKKVDTALPMRMARHHCREAEKLDWYGELSNQLAALNQKLDELVALKKKLVEAK